MITLKINKTHFMRSMVVATLSALTLSVVSPVVVLASSGEDVAVTNHNNDVTAGETKQALQSVPGILGSSDQVATSTDGDSAIVATTAGSVVDVPKDLEQGVTFGATSGPKLEIELPNADQAGAAKQVAPGVVAYDSGNGSANAVQATEDGGVRMLTVIDNSNAPTTYDYKVTVPNGGRIELIEDGGAIVVDGNGELLSAVSAPWAKDANGAAVTTYFETDGQTLTQHVQHNVPGVVYPVTADPAWLAIAAGVVGWAAARCAGTVLGDLGLSAVRWALRDGDWYWSKKLEDAVWACAWGIAGGGVLRFAPSSVKSWTASQITNLSKNILRWK